MGVLGFCFLIFGGGRDSVILFYCVREQRGGKGIFKRTVGLQVLRSSASHNRQEQKQDGSFILFFIIISLG